MNAKDAKVGCGGECSGCSGGCHNGGAFLSQAVRRHDVYTTTGYWEDGDRSLCVPTIRDLWLNYLIVKINPDANFTGVPTLRVWNTFMTPPNDPSFQTDRLVLEQQFTTADLLTPFKWEPPILMYEEATMQYGDGRMVRMVYFMRFYFNLGCRVQVLDDNGGTLTVVPNAMHMTCEWMI